MLGTLPIYFSTITLLKSLCIKFKVFLSFIFWKALPFTSVKVVNEFTPLATLTFPISLTRIYYPASILLFACSLVRFSIESTSDKVAKVID